MRQIAIAFNCKAQRQANAAVAYAAAGSRPGSGKVDEVFSAVVACYRVLAFAAAPLAGLQGVVQGSLALCARGLARQLFQFARAVFHLQPFGCGSLTLPAFQLS